LFASDFSYLNRSGVFSYPSYSRNFSRIGHRPLTIFDVDRLGSWMTFNYLNKGFKIPPDYLKSQLGITDKAYPNITISKIAKEKNISGSVYLQTVKDTVRNYLVSIL